MAISVTVDDQGRLVAVNVNRTWRREVSADGFAGTLFASYLSAVQERLAEQLSARVAGRPGHRAPARPAGDDLVADAREAVEQSQAALRTLRDARRDKEEITEIRGARGYLTLRTCGGGAVGLTGNVPAIDKANGDLLAQDAMDVFRRANLTES